MEHQDQPNSATRPTGLIPHPKVSNLLRREGQYPPNYGYGFDAPDEEEGSNVLIEYSRILRRNKFSIIFASLLGLTVGFGVGIPMTPIYRANTTLEVLSINEDFMNMRQSSQTTTNLDADTSEEQTQAKLLEGRALMARVVSKFKKDQSPQPPPEEISPSIFSWRAWVARHLSQPGGQIDELLAKAASTVKVKPSGRTRLLEVTVDSKNPKFAANFANTLVQEFIAQNLEARYQSTHRTSEWLAREIEDARRNLQNSEDALQSYARSSGIIFTDDSTNVATEKLQQLQVALSAATTERIAKQSKFELAKSSPAESLGDVVNDPGLREITNKINDLNRELADLSAIFNPEYSKIKRTKAEIESLHATLEKTRAVIIARIENDFQEASRKEKLLAGAYEEQTNQVTGQGEKAIQYNILKREVDSNRQLYDTMLQQTKQATVASAMRASNVRVVDPAEVPLTPVSPNFRLNSLGGAFAGLFLSVVIVTMREKADRTLQQPGDVKLWLNLPELGAIPGAAHMGKLYGYRKAQSTAKLGAASSFVTPTKSAVELITWERKPSAMAEAFRSSLTSILFVGENGSQPQVLVFTSVNPADGKTTVVSNIAIASAEIRRKVLVIDADLRRPRMHEIFKLENTSGMTDLLSSEFSQVSLSNFIQETAIPGLHVLPGGPPTLAAAHLLHSPNFPLLLSIVRQEYDLILIDTPPMMQMTDARIVGRLADAAVLVARAGQTTRDYLAMARDRLSEDRIRIIGAILNDWDPKRATKGHYSTDYGYSYYESRNSE